MRKAISFMMSHPLCAGIVGIIVAISSIRFCRTEGDPLSEGILRMLLLGTMAFFLYFVSREKTLEKCGVETGYVLKVLSPLLITSLLLGGLGILGRALDQTALRPDWISYFCVMLFQMLFVGLFEETAFRALLNDAIVYQFRSFKHVFLLSAIVSSLVFGYVHVMFVPLNSPLMVGQVVGKTISTGLFGLASLFLYWKTRNIWACGLLHGLFDFLVSMPAILFAEEVAEASASSYAVQGSDGFAIIIVYVIDLVINAAICFAIWKKIGKAMDFEEMRKTW